MSFIIGGKTLKRYIPDTDETSVTIPEGIERIGKEAFSGCKNLEEVIIPDSVSFVGSGAFQYCDGLVRVVLPQHLKSILGRTFYKCTNLKEIVFPSVLEKIGSEAFYKCSSLESVELPDSLVRLDGGFSRCDNLRHIKLPRNLTCLGSAFSSCRSLNSIIWPDALKRIESAAFKSCSGLGEISIPQSVESIGTMAFERCSSLQCVYVPASITDIEDYAFDVRYDTKIVFSDGFCVSSKEFQLLHWNEISACPVAVIDLLKQSLSETENFKIGRLIQETSVNPKAQVMTLSRYFFWHLDRFTDDEVATVKGLIKARIRSILKECIIRSDVVSVSAIIKTALLSVRNIEWALSVAAETENPTITALLLEYSNSIPDEEREKEEQRKWNEMLKAPLYDAEAAELKATWSYEKNASGYTITSYKGTEKHAIIPEAIKGVPITELGAEAFSSMRRGITKDRKDWIANELTEISIPNSIRVVGEKAFLGCNNLSTINAGSNSNFVDCDGILFSADYSELIFCPRTKKGTVVAPNTLKKIRGGALSECVEITHFDITNTQVTEIGDCAFFHCIGLRSIEIPKSCTYIGKHAFAECINLQNISLNGLSRIETGNFYNAASFFNCKSLSKIVFCNRIITLPSRQKMRAISEWQQYVNALYDLSEKEKQIESLRRDYSELMREYDEHVSFARNSLKEKCAIAAKSKRGLLPHELVAIAFCQSWTIDGPLYGNSAEIRACGVDDFRPTYEALIERGFVSLCDCRYALSKAVVPELKDFLKSHSQKIGGNKSELIERILNTIPETVIAESFPLKFYVVTELGEQELNDNGYVRIVLRDLGNTMYKGNDVDLWELSTVFAENEGLDFDSVVAKCGVIRMTDYEAELVQLKDTYDRPYSPFVDRDFYKDTNKMRQINYQIFHEELEYKGLERRAKQLDEY